MLNDGNPCTQFMTIHEPNTTVKDVSQFVPPTGFDPDDPPYTNIGAAHAHKAARSRHTGTVNVAFADGSVRIIQDGIALEVWRAMGSMNGEEVAASE
jgi:prepilin-type processing-associated H-X9-DG protein